MEQTLDYLIVMKPVTGTEIRTEGLQFFTSISEQFFKSVSAYSNFYAKVLSHNIQEFKDLADGFSITSGFGLYKKSTLEQKL
ncbi:hypothetical protein CEE36_11490 [candidate division TA06 bacterium B3_TA06]|uniref:Uncharacterized protein n=1 Tax=candidate division TA06 bacterium B3_TA06 TaxID=2012487 RepID=A0A532UNP7_UNCT6|nr:MAG: hypothetical protein CEE36_11490 [candidate division TA06 bacterium B3_TA06]